MPRPMEAQRKNPRSRSSCSSVLRPAASGRGSLRQAAPRWGSLQRPAPRRGSFGSLLRSGAPGRPLLIRRFSAGFALFVVADHPIPALRALALQAGASRNVAFTESALRTDAVDIDAAPALPAAVHRAPAAPATAAHAPAAAPALAQAAPASATDPAAAPGGSPAAGAPAAPPAASPSTLWHGCALLFPSALSTETACRRRSARPQAGLGRWSEIPCMRPPSVGNSPRFV